ncbi:MAG: hypothetical protein HY720_01585 [Planctomycetes bacterium]|nr:hypothetical protein [Planctomycetota bacterium]
MRPATHGWTLAIVTLFCGCGSPQESNRDESMAEVPARQGPAAKTATVSVGDEYDLSAILVPGQVTLVEFGASW